MNFNLKWSFFLTLFLCLNEFAWAQPTAGNGMGGNIIAPDGSTQLTNPATGECITVTNTTAKNIFFPFNTASEATQNLPNFPVGLQIGTCGPVAPGACSADDGTNANPPDFACAEGTSSGPSAGPPYAWTCTTTGGVANCSSGTIFMCGDWGKFDSNPQTMPTTAWGATALCADGSNPPVTGTDPWYWTCPGTPSASCGTVLTSMGKCNSYVPNTCTVGTYNDLPDTATEFKWECIGTTTASCSAPNTICGPDHLSGNTTILNPCIAGRPWTAMSLTDPKYWTCLDADGSGPGEICHAGPTPPVINGTCGPASWQWFDNPPGLPIAHDQLCSKGTQGQEPYWMPEYKRWSWTCEGSGGGTQQQCYAYDNAYPTIEGVATCGTDQDKVVSYVSDTVASPGLGATVNASCVTEINNGNTPLYNSASGRYEWRCSTQGTVTPFHVCSTSPVVTNGACGPANGTPSPIALGQACSSGTIANYVMSAAGDTWNCNGSGGGTNASCSGGPSASSYAWVYYSGGICEKSASLCEMQEVYYCTFGGVPTYYPSCVSNLGNPPAPAVPGYIPVGNPAQATQAFASCVVSTGGSGTNSCFAYVQDQVCSGVVACFSTP